MNQNWKKLLLIQAGGVICLPVFIIGHALAKNFGIYSAILAIICGNLLLLAMGIVLALPSVTHRKSTAETAVDVFGLKGKELFSGAMVISMIGWFAIQLNIMTSAFQNMLNPEMIICLNIVLGIAITLVGIKGMRSLTLLATFSMPFLIITILYALYSVSDYPMITTEQEVISIGGFSLVLACGIAAVIDLPTFFRLAASKKDGLIAVCLLFGFVLPLVEGVGLYLFMHAQREHLAEVLALSSDGIVWKIWVMAFLILAGWTTNNANLYSATVSLQTLIPGLTETSRTLILGLIGTFLACFNFLDHLILVLDLIGVLLGSMGAVIVFHFAFKQQKDEKENIIAWISGITCGFISYYGYTYSNTPVLDAFTFALITKIIFKVIKNEKTINIRS